MQTTKEFGWIPAASSAAESSVRSLPLCIYAVKMNIDTSFIPSLEYVGPLVVSMSAFNSATYVKMKAPLYS